MAAKFQDIDMKSLVEQVLPFRSAGYQGKLMEKLLEEGIIAPSDMLQASKEALETKLSTHSSFSFIEMADTLSLRSSMEPDSEKPKAAVAARGSSLQRRGRSRSPVGRSFSGGRRANSRPQRSNNHRDNRGQGRHNSSSNGPRSRGGKAEPPELWRAVEKGDEGLVRDLLEQGKDPEERFQGWTPFMKAAEEDKGEILRLLHEKGVDIEAANRRGRTALSFAAAPSMKRHTAKEALRLLLEEFHADAKKKCERGLTPLDYAKDEKREDAVAILEQFGRR
jgi:hypothetical protein